MPRFVIERTVPGASKLTGQQLRDIYARSSTVVAGFGEPYAWITSYVAGDKLYCIHEASSAELVYRHAGECGLPADVVTEIAAEIGPEIVAERPVSPASRNEPAGAGSRSAR